MNTAPKVSPVAADDDRVGGFFRQLIFDLIHLGHDVGHGLARAVVSLMKAWMRLVPCMVVERM